jgi:signal peptidase I
MSLQSKKIVADPMSVPSRSECAHSMAVEVLQSSGRLRLQVTGTSMLPTLWPGDLLSIESSSSRQVCAGEIVLYERDGRMFVHRVVQVSVDGDGAITTRGDCMPGNDLPLSPTGILGRVTELRRRNQRITIPANIARSQRLLGWLLCRSDLFYRAGLHWHAIRYGHASKETGIVNASSA